MTRLAFYGLSNYNDPNKQSSYKNNVFINTPITADANGNIYFGVQVTNPALVGGLTSSIVRIDASGNATTVPVTTAANNSGMTQVVYNCAPALSNDGKTLYVAVNNGNGNSGIQSLTARDANADPLEDMFNFSKPPSLNTPVTTAPPASPTDPGCPFVPGGPQG